ncbi:MAG: class I SAM-dependent methyltransferase [Halanaerobium sp.]
MFNKTLVINLMLRFILFRPSFVESTVFRKIMMIFPSFLSGRIDFDALISKEENYDLAIKKALEKYQELKADKTDKILDLAAGTGAISVILAENFKESEVIAVDLAEEMLAEAEKKASQKSLNNLRTKINDVYNLDFKDDSFDLVTVSNAPFSFKEVKRVLKEDAFFIITISHGGGFLEAKKEKLARKLKNQGFNLEAVAAEENSGVYLILKN